MSILRRSTAFALSLLLVQLLLVGDVWCMGHAAAGGDSVGARSADHTAMTMHSANAAAINPAHAPIPHSHDGCASTPLTTGECAMPASCAAPSLPVHTPMALGAALVDGERWTDPALARPAPLPPPEPPPPRA